MLYLLYQLWINITQSIVMFDLQNFKKKSKNKFPFIKKNIGNYIWHGTRDRNWAPCKCKHVLMFYKYSPAFSPNNKHRHCHRQYLRRILSSPVSLRSNCFPSLSLSYQFNSIIHFQSLPPQFSQSLKKKSTSHYTTSIIYFYAMTCIFFTHVSN